MKINNYIKNTEKENFRKILVYENIRRGKILALSVIVFEIVLIIADVCASVLAADQRFHFNRYLIMYTVMLGINVSYLLYLNRFEKLRIASDIILKITEKVIVSYLTMIMCWGSVISLMDQRLYGQLIVFMIILIISSVLYFIDYKNMFIPYFFSTALIFVGLPFFQNSTDILVGHYVNLLVFITVSWLVSRIVFNNFISDFKNKMLLQKTNELLEKEIAEKKEINDKLSRANLHLEKLALLDELTGVSNRRDFRNYVDIAFERYVKPNSLMSILMIDIDFFKQVNDYYGHNKGDEVLIAVSKQIDSLVKNNEEFFGRWGGEEFIYAVFNADKEYTENLAETIRRKVSELKIPNEFAKTGSIVSVSIGICTIRVIEKEKVRVAIELADKALYLAKNSGRNCVKSIDGDL